jgi:hypothetical protein
MSSHDDSFQREVLTQLGDIKALCATSAARNDALDQRVGSLEASNVRQWWATAGIIPLLAVLHGIARRLGANI